MSASSVNMVGSMANSTDGEDSSPEDSSSCVQGINREETIEIDGYPKDMIGWSVLKADRGLDGILESYDSETRSFKILYENGKYETVRRVNVIHSYRPLPPEQAPPRGVKPLMMRADNHIPRQRRGAGKGKKRAGAQNAPAGQSGGRSSKKGKAIADLGNEESNKKKKRQNVGGSKAPGGTQKKRQAKHSSRNI